MRVRHLIFLLALSLALPAIGETSGQVEQQTKKPPPANCSLGGAPVAPGRVHRWCTGTPGPGDTCQGGQFMCKTCIGPNWTDPIRC
jgi:hypothetical protein